MNNKADLTSTQLIIIILLIIGFAIILFLYWQLSWTGMVNRETCHQSIVLRATMPSSILGAKEYTPLNCKTRKVCITDKLLGGDCDEFKGEKYDKVKIKGNVESKKKQIRKFIADEMAECWSMMGEGKVQVFEREAVLQAGLRRCAICSRIAFGKSVKEKIKEVEALGQYLTRYKAPNVKISYWEFLTSGLSTEGYDASLDKFSTDEKAIVFMEFGKTNLPSWIITIFGASGAGIIGAKIGGAIGSIVPVGGTIAGGVIGFIGGAIIGGVAGAAAGEAVEENLITARIGSATFAAGNFFLDYNSAKLTSLECDSFENIP